ncbi:50S ribosomal protein L25 [Chloroflexota bacterium]
METLKLQVSKRDITGKKVARLRRQGITPVHLFGHSIESLALQCETALLVKVLRKAGMTRSIDLTIEGANQTKSVFVREAQLGHISRELLHVDFYQVRKGEKIKMDIPIILIGEAPGMKLKGRMLSRGITMLHVESTPEILPSEIQVDISGLETLDQAIHVKDITLNPEISVQTDSDQLVVKITEAASVRADEDEAEEAAAEAGEAGEVEVVGARAPAEEPTEE